MLLSSQVCGTYIGGGGGSVTGSMGREECTDTLFDEGCLWVWDRSGEGRGAERWGWKMGRRERRVTLRRGGGSPWAAGGGCGQNMGDGTRETGEGRKKT
jgi:hypothetical protein